MRAVPSGTSNNLVCKYVGDKIGVTFDPAMCQSFAVLNDNGDFVAGAVISNFRTHDCEMSCAADSKLAWKPHVLRAIFQYVFDQLGCVRVTAITKKTHRRGREFLEGLGFVLEGNLRKAFDGEKDALIYGLLREECRYITEDAPGAEASENPQETGDLGAVNG